MENKKSKMFCVRLKSQVYADLLSLSLASGSSMSDIINHVLAEHIIKSRRLRLVIKDLYENN